MKYAILLYPHPNKRYYESMKKLCLNEFAIVTKNFTNKISNVGYENIGGLELFSFSANELSVRELKAINYLSCNYILFQVKDEQYLKPINDDKNLYFRSDFASILKYKGKTNEMFTDMMINIGIFSSDFYDEFDKPLSILDPMCGKGTTLYQGLVKGYNVAGIEINTKDALEINSFLQRYFEYHKYKYNTSSQKISLNGKKIGAKYIFETADTISNYKNKERRTVQFVNGNTILSSNFYKKESFNTVIIDIPYGVQHAGTSESKVIKMEDLIKDSLGGWIKLLKKGGSIVISFNANTLKRKSLEEIVSNFGLKILNEEPYDKFEHWVEQAVNRDIFVVRKEK